MFDTTQGTYSKAWLYPLIFWIPLDLTFFWMVNLVTHFSTQKHISDLQQQRFRFSHLKHREFHSWTQILINHPHTMVFNLCLVNRPWNSLRTSGKRRISEASARQAKGVWLQAWVVPRWVSMARPRKLSPWKLLGSLGIKEWHAQRFTN